MLSITYKAFSSSPMQQPIIGLIQLRWAKPFSGPNMVWNLVKVRFFPILASILIFCW